MEAWFKLWAQSIAALKYFAGWNVISPLGGNNREMAINIEVSDVSKDDAVFEAAIILLL